MKWPTSDKFNIEEHTILLGYRGSISHGTYIPSEREGIDDKDALLERTVHSIIGKNIE